MLCCFLANMSWFFFWGSIKLNELNCIRAVKFIGADPSIRGNCKSSALVSSIRRETMYMYMYVAIWFKGAYLVYSSVSTVISSLKGETLAYNETRRGTTAGFPLWIRHWTRVV